jgi:hypothetical protein
MFADTLCSLRYIKSLYEALNKVYLGALNPSLVSFIRHFSISTRLVMITHVKWRFKNTITCYKALSY